MSTDIAFVSNFDQLPDDSLVSAKVAKLLLGNVLTERTLRRDPPIPRRQISQRRYGFRVGDLRQLIRSEIANRNDGDPSA